MLAQRPHLPTQPDLRLHSVDGRRLSDDAQEATFNGFLRHVDVLELAPWTTGAIAVCTGARTGPRLRFRRRQIVESAALRGCLVRCRLCFFRLYLDRGYHMPS